MRCSYAALSFCLIFQPVTSPSSVNSTFVFDICRFRLALALKCFYPLGQGLQANGNQASLGEQTLYAQSFEVSSRIVFHAVVCCYSRHMAAGVGRPKYGREPPETM